MSKKIISIIMAMLILLMSGCGKQQEKIYTPEDVVEICGFGKERSRDFEMRGVESVNVMPTKSSVDEHFDCMDFYIFDSVEDAKKAFKRTDSWFEEIEEEGDDYRKGWLADVSDASVEKYEYLTGNMIILVHTQVVSSWGEYIEPESENEDITDDKEEIKEADGEAVDYWSQSYRDEVIALMRETFG